MIIIGIIIVVAMTVAFMLCMRISEWHSSESDYWHRIHLLVLLNPALDARYRPILEWAKANKPSLWARAVRGWQDPPARMLTSALVSHFRRGAAS